jgi:hypothetical protein
LSFKNMSRNEIFQSIISQLEKEKLELEEALANSKAAAKEAPGAMQSHSDTTRAQEQTRSAELAPTSSPSWKRPSTRRPATS